MNKQLKIDELEKLFNAKKILITKGSEEVAVTNDNIVNNRLLIEIESNIIGDKEVSFLNLIVKKILEKELHIKKMCILIPEKLEHFASAFVSTLYIANKSLCCEVVLYGKENGRLLELIGLMYSAMMAPQEDNFFSLVTCDDKNSHKEWGGDISSKDPRVNKIKFPISDKNLPLIPINEKNNQALFLKKNNISTYLKNKDYALIEGDYKTKSVSFYKNFYTFSKRKQTINTAIP